MANFDYTYNIKQWTQSGDDIYIKYADGDFSGANWGTNAVALIEDLRLNRFKASLNDTKTFFVYRNSSQITFEANVGDYITANAHGLVNGETIYLWGGDLPEPFTRSTLYYVRDSAANTFGLAATAGGAAIDITDTGTGVMFFIAPSKRSINDEPDIGYVLASATAVLTPEGEEAIAAAVLVELKADADFGTAGLLLDAENAALEILKVPRAAAAVTAGSPQQRHLENVGGDTLQTIYEVIDGDV